MRFILVPQFIAASTRVLFWNNNGQQSTHRPRRQQWKNYSVLSMVASTRRSTVLVTVTVSLLIAWQVFGSFSSLSGIWGSIQRKQKVVARTRNSTQVMLVMTDNRFSDPNHWIQLSSAINRAYAENHGYGFYACNSNEKNECHGHVPAACKLFCVRDALLMLPEVNTVVYLDSDAIVRNFSQSIDGFVRENAPSHGSSYDLVLPTDCSDYQFNTGLQIWQNSASARDLLDEWINRTVTNPRYRGHPFEQQAFKDFYNEENSTITDRLISIPYGPETWHVGSCKPGDYIAPQFIAHITGRWPSWRERTMIDTIRSLCPDKYNFSIPQCEWLVNITSTKTP